MFATIGISLENARRNTEDPVPLLLNATSRRIIVAVNCYRTLTYIISREIKRFK